MTALAWPVRIHGTVACRMGALVVGLRRLEMVYEGMDREALRPDDTDQEQYKYLPPSGSAKCEGPTRHGGPESLGNNGIL